MSISVQIQKRFSDFVLDVEFESNGEPMAILGSSGCGKSMTLKCIAGIETPDKGRIVWNGRTLFDSQKRINIHPQERNVGYLFQHYALFPNMTVYQNIACALSKTEKKKRPDKIRMLMERFGIQDLHRHYPSQLSGGQQQRVALARIWAYQPEILLLDEPFSALDSFLREGLQVAMMDWMQEYNGDILMVTHSRDEAYNLCTQLLVLDDGKALRMGQTKQLFHDPKILHVARLTGCKNISKAIQTGSQEIEAVDWGMCFSVSRPIPDHLTHIGIRAHDFYPCECRENAYINAMPIQIIKRMESPFEWNVLFRYANAKTPQNHAIWWKYSKESAVHAAATSLAVAPENILLLQQK